MGVMLLIKDEILNKLLYTSVYFSQLLFKLFRAPIVITILSISKI